MIDRSQITALILAGGKSRRMGGNDKALLQYGGATLIEQVLCGIAPQVGNVLISANRNRGFYEGLGVPVVADPIDGFQGPLAGFLAGLEAMHTDYLVTLPCDGPVVLPGLVVRLATAFERTGVDIAVAHDGRRLQPVHALLHRRVLPGLRRALADGERKIDRWYALNHWVAVDFADAPEQFDNINTPDDYARVQAGRVAEQS